MRLIPHGSISHGRGWRSTCGQAALAMIANTSIEAAATAIGHRRPTTYADLTRGLDALGIRRGDRKTIRQHGSMSDRLTYLVRVRGRDPARSYDHWIVRHLGLIYDSAIPGAPLPNNDYLFRYGVVLSSYLPVTPVDASAQEPERSPELAAYLRRSSVRI